MENAKEKIAKKKISNARNAQNEEAKKTKRRLRIGGFFGLVFLLLYMPSMWNWLFAGKIDTAVLRSGMIEDTIQVQGIFVRDEILLSSPFKGICLPEAEYGERVPVNFIAATVVKESEYELIQQVKDMEGGILQREFEDKDIDAADDLEDTEFGRTLDKEVSDLVSVSHGNSFLELYDLREGINELLYKHGKTLLQDTEDKVYLKTEKEELEKLKNRLQESKRDVITENSGILLYNIDGYEEALTPDKIPAMTREELDSVTVESDEENGYSSPEPFQVEAGQPFAKLLTSSGSYYVFSVPVSDADEIDKGMKLEMYIDGMDRHIPGEITYKSEPYLGQTIMALYFNHGVEETISLRKAQAYLIVNSYSGLKLPTRCLANMNTVDGTAEIVILKNNYASYRRVKILGINGSSCIIDNLDNSLSEERVSLYDQYICNPENIKEGQMIKQ